MSPVAQYYHITNNTYYYEMLEVGLNSIIKQYFHQTPLSANLHYISNSGWAAGLSFYKLLLNLYTTNKHDTVM